jgi:hypothetical protein
LTPEERAEAHARFTANFKKGGEEWKRKHGNTLPKVY